MTTHIRYQVFLSSTFRDLRDEREAVARELLKADFTPVGMENFSASDDRGWETITRTIDLSDYYVLIVAGRYGSVDKAKQKSWTELEYEYAREKDIPVLAFLRELGSIAGDQLYVLAPARRDVAP